MKFRTLAVWAVGLVCAALLFVSCKSAAVRSGPGPKVGHGPPPHAPAHGYRHKYDGMELVYDSGRGVYVVVGFPLHFYCEGWFYRFREAYWEVSVNISRQWKAISEESLPAGLRVKEKGEGKLKEHPGRGRGNEKK